VLGNVVSFLFAHGFPVEIQTVNESPPFSRVVLLEAEAEEHGLGACESSAKVLRGGEGQAENKVGIVVFLAFIFQAWVGSTIGRGGIGGEREIFLEKRRDVRFGLRGRFIAIGAGFDLGQDCVGVSG
jgi:hypothetical protein